MGDPERTVFYVIAFQRSGTTLLSYLLDAHPEVLCVNEFELAKHIVYGQRDLLVDLTNPEIRRVLDYYGVEPAAYLALWERFRAGRADAARFLVDAYDLCNRKGARAIGAKEVCDIVAYERDFVKKLLRLHGRGVKVVFIERDIKGVVGSFVKLGFIPPARQAVTVGSVRRFAWAYVRVLNYIDRQLARGVDVIRLRYEELVADPLAVLARVFGFLGVEASPEAVSALTSRSVHAPRFEFSGVRVELAADWQRRLSMEQIQMLDRIYATGRR